MLLHPSKVNVKAVIPSFPISRVVISFSPGLTIAILTEGGLRGATLVSIEAPRRE